MKIDADGLADLFFQLNWESESARHTDCFAAKEVNFWRDLLPPTLLEVLKGKQPGDRVRVPLKNGNGLGPRSARRLIGVEPGQFQPSQLRTDAEPRLGRFYPQGLLKGVPGVFRANQVPFRLVGREADRLCVDLNHPLAEVPLDLSATVGQVRPKLTERGGTSYHWLEVLTTGPGMQAPINGSPTQFFDDDPFVRQDSQPDTRFYRNSRLVQHLDDQAIEVVRDLYGRFVQPGMQVLDLMGSWDSHLPQDLQLQGLTVLGLNGEELDQNRQLTQGVVQDLNIRTRLPFDDAVYDVVICTVSVEYLTNPLAIFKEVRRILKPEGYFVVTFSNRWFAPKVVRIWTELHEFERLGLVSEYFRLSGGFDRLNTYSVRGLARPASDKYYHQNSISDPVYGVWAQRKP